MTIKLHHGDALEVLRGGDSVPENDKAVIQARGTRCRCRGHGAPEIIDPCIRELADCLNRHGVQTLASCCGHGGGGDIILCVESIEPNIVASGDQIGWRLKLAPKPVVFPYSDETLAWGKGSSDWRHDHDD